MNVLWSTHTFNNVVNIRWIENNFELVNASSIDVLTKVLTVFRHSGNHSIILTILLSTLVLTIILNVCGQQQLFYNLTKPHYNSELFSNLLLGEKYTKKRRK